MTMETEEEKHDVQYKIHSCYICEKTFARSSSMYRHIRNFHKENMKFPTSKSIVCPLCSDKEKGEFSFTNYKKLHSHMKSQHNLKLNIQKHVFQTVEEFQEWKVKIEQETKSQYVKQNGTKKCGNFETLRYYCNRSGFYKPTGHQKRQLKKQGSNKINCCCPSMIKAIINSKTNATEVEYVVNHVGHIQELDHLFLTKSERQWIAHKLEQGVDISNILDTVRGTQSGDKNRLHLLTRKDVLNINKTTVKSKHKVNIDDWFNSIDKNNPEKVVLFYKPQDAVTETFPQLESDDFVLMLMNEYQADVFRQFAGQTVSISTVQGKYLYGVHMTVVTVMDADHSAVPVAFMFSSRVDEDTLRAFFIVLQTEIGSISTQIFVSDDDDDYLTAWRSVMGDVEHNLLSSWSVDRGWERNLPKIKARKLKAYKLLRKLMNETNEQIFLDLLAKTVEQLNADLHLKEFAQFFDINYANRPREWANCYRIQYGLTGTKHLETIHKTLKQLYLQGKKVRSLSKTIEVLMEFLRDYYLNKMLVCNGDENLAKMMVKLEERHETCVHLQSHQLFQHSDEKWTWKSETEEECTVVVAKKDCLCNVKCNSCNQCVHNFTCTCLDSVLFWNMCRHIHLLCLSVRVNVDGGGEAQPIEFYGIDQPQEMVVQVNSIPVNDTKLDELKEKVVKDLQLAIENVGNVKTFDSLEVFYNDSCRPMCEALEGLLNETSTITVTDNMQTYYFVIPP
uniref:C2H2-type domain-containing protein n=1 Tax=Strigamia maritima TaxID=126957 RepID=T1J170_STRMM